MSRPALLMAAVLMLAACGKPAPAYHEKTPQERADTYHRELTTPDLRLFGLRGAVMEAELPPVAGGGAAMVVRFQPNGMLNAATLGGDSLTIVRNNAGEILHLQTSGGLDLLPILRKAAPKPRNVVYY